MHLLFWFLSYAFCSSHALAKRSESGANGVSVFIYSPSTKASQNAGSDTWTVKEQQGLKKLKRPIIRQTLDGRYVEEIVDGVMLQTEVGSNEVFVPGELIVSTKKLLSVVQHQLRNPKRISFRDERSPVRRDVKSNGSQNVPLQGQRMPFSFQYVVDDELTQNFQTRQEESDAKGVVKGCYQILEPEGMVRTVTYLADSQGFKVVSISKGPDKVPCSGSSDENFRTPFQKAFTQDFGGKSLSNSNAQQPPINRQQLPINRQQPHKQIVQSHKEVPLKPIQNQMKNEAVSLTTNKPTEIKSSIQNQREEDSIVSYINNLSETLLQSFKSTVSKNDVSNHVNFPFVLIPISTFFQLRQQGHIDDDVQGFGAVIQPAQGGRGGPKNLFQNGGSRPREEINLAQQSFDGPQISGTKSVQSVANVQPYTSTPAITSTHSVTSKENILQPSSNELTNNYQSPNTPLGKVAVVDSQVSQSQVASSFSKDIYSKETSTKSLPIRQDDRKKSNVKSTNRGKLGGQINQGKQYNHGSQGNGGNKIIRGNQRNSGNIANQGNLNNQGHQNSRQKQGNRVNYADSGSSQSGLESNISNNNGVLTGNGKEKVAYNNAVSTENIANIPDSQFTVQSNADTVKPVDSNVDIDLPTSINGFKVPAISILPLEDSDETDFKLPEQLLPLSDSFETLNAPDQKALDSQAPNQVYPESLPVPNSGSSVTDLFPNQPLVETLLPSFGDKLPDEDYRIPSDIYKIPKRGHNGRSINKVKQNAGPELASSDNVNYNPNFNIDQNNNVPQSSSFAENQVNKLPNKNLLQLSQIATQLPIQSPQDDALKQTPTQLYKPPTQHQSQTNVAFEENVNSQVYQQSQTNENQINEQNLLNSNPAEIQIFDQSIQDVGQIIANFYETPKFDQSRPHQSSQFSKESETQFSQLSSQAFNVQDQSPVQSETSSLNLAFPNTQENTQSITQLYETPNPNHNQINQIQSHQQTSSALPNLAKESVINPLYKAPSQPPNQPSQSDLQSHSSFLQTSNNSPSNSFQSDRKLSKQKESAQILTQLYETPNQPSQIQSIQASQPSKQTVSQLTQVPKKEIKQSSELSKQVITQLYETPRQTLNQPNEVFPEQTKLLLSSSSSLQTQLPSQFLSQSSNVVNKNINPSKEGSKQIIIQLYQAPSKTPNQSDTQSQSQSFQTSNKTPSSAAQSHNQIMIQRPQQTNKIPQQSLSQLYQSPSRTASQSNPTPLSSNSQSSFSNLNMPQPFENSKHSLSQSPEGSSQTFPNKFVDSSQQSITQLYQDPSPSPSHLYQVPKQLTSQSSLDLSPNQSQSSKQAKNRSNQDNKQIIKQSFDEASNINPAYQSSTQSFNKDTRQNQGQSTRTNLPTVIKLHPVRNQTPFQSAKTPSKSFTQSQHSQQQNQNVAFQQGDQSQSQYSQNSNQNPNPTFQTSKQGSTQSFLNKQKTNHSFQRNQVSGQSTTQDFQAVGQYLTPARSVTDQPYQSLQSSASQLYQAPRQNPSQGSQFDTQLYQTPSPQQNFGNSYQAPSQGTTQSLPDFNQNSAFQNFNPTQNNEPFNNNNGQNDQNPRQFYNAPKQSSQRASTRQSYMSKQLSGQSLREQSQSYKNVNMNGNNGHFLNEPQNLATKPSNSYNSPPSSFPVFGQKIPKAKFQPQNNEPTHQQYNNQQKPQQHSNQPKPQQHNNQQTSSYSSVPKVTKTKMKGWSPMQSGMTY